MRYASVEGPLLVGGLPPPLKSGPVAGACSVVRSADGNYEVSYKPNVVIQNTGKIMWIPIAIYKSSCVINVQYFPFDEQKCEMVFGSWTFNADQVTLGWYEGEPKVRI